MQNDFHPDSNNNIPPIAPVAAGFIGLIGVFILYQFVGSIITLAIFGLDIEHADVNLMRMMTIAGQILFILLPALILAKFVHFDVTRALRVRLPAFKETAAFVFGLILLTPLLQNYVFLQNKIIEAAAEHSGFVESIKGGLDKLDGLLESTFVNLLSANNAFETVLVIVVIAVTPAICEEVFFRGYVQKSFEIKWTPFKSILVTSIFFGLYHFNPYGLPALIALGFFFGYAVYKSNSIVVPIVLHFINNFIAAVAYFIYGSEDIIATTTEGESLEMSLISFVILLFLFLGYMQLVRKNYSQLTNKPSGV